MGPGRAGLDPHHLEFNASETDHDFRSICGGHGTSAV